MRRSNQTPVRVRRVIRRSKDSLLQQDIAASPMTFEDNMAFIKDQIDTFADMLADGDQVIEAKENQVAAIMTRMRELNAQVRALRKTLHSDGRVPSYAAVQERLKIDAQLAALQEASKTYDDAETGIRTLVQDWVAVRGRLTTLTDVSLSPADEGKLARLQESFIAQLRAYDFTSFPIDQIAISRESYRPSRDGYDVGLTSASDTIRMIWAYLLGMLEVSRSAQTNHLGLLIFDEPRQQGAQAISFDALLKRAAEAGSVGQQVIFTTSEEPTLLESILAGTECNYIRFDGKVLRPMAETPKQEPEPDDEVDVDEGDSPAQN